MAPPVKMRGDGRKASNPKKTLLRLLGYMRQHIPEVRYISPSYSIRTRVPR